MNLRHNGESFFYDVKLRAEFCCCCFFVVVDDDEGGE